MQNWNSYETYMEELQNNYLALSHLLQFFKKQVCHLILQNAFNHINLSQNT